MSKKVIIIGAGIGGLATANLLAKAGYEVEVYEKEATPGGRAGTLSKDGFVFDTGPSWYLMPEVFEHYFSLMDERVSEQIDLVRLQPAYKVFFEQEAPVSITGNIEHDATTFDLIEPGSGDVLKKYVEQSDKIYQLSLRHFLYSNFSSARDFLQPEVLSNSIPMMKLATTSIDSYVSSFFKDRRLQQILEYPMVFLGTSPFKAPAIYSLMSALDFKEGVFYPQGGIYTIIEKLFAIGKKNGVQYFFNEPVKKIIAEDKRAKGIVRADDSPRYADIIISNADVHFTETQLLDSEHQTYPESYWSKKKPSPSALLLYVGVEGKVPEFEHHNLLFVDEWQENFEAIYEHKKAPQPASMYICKPSHTDPSVAPEGHENIFVLVPLPPGIELDTVQTESLIEHYLQQIAAMTGVDIARRMVSRTVFGPNDFATKYHSWQSSMLGQSHELNQSAFFRTKNKSGKVKNLFYVGGSTTPGIGLPMCLIGAELIYKRLAGDTRGGRVSRIEKIGEEFVL